MNPNELRDVALSLLQPKSVFYMATVEDGYPRVRPMTCLHSEGFKIWTCSKKQTPKVQQILKNNEVEACFLGVTDQQLRIRGTVSILEDDESWSRLPIPYESLPMLEDPDFVLLLIEPREVFLVDNWSTDYQPIAI